MKRTFRLMPALAPFWQRYGSGPANPAIVCLAQRGPELWWVRADGPRCWMQQGPAWYELNPASARKLLLRAGALRSGEDGRVCLSLRPCRPLGEHTTAWPPQDAAPPAEPGDAGIDASADHLLKPLRAWSDSHELPVLAASTVRVVHKRSRRIVRPGDNPPH